ncbi:VQ motif-containing protein 11-like [Phragmites australis]|uniref:VQ motif-containing protein 11-like n=1 Tax=Phragmites australis TaxID=29695 RepID=UPI002D76A0CB|nr:VQ motif-containing protein 11-like [Phragmites australis]
MASRKVVREAATSCMDANTTFVQADPATFRALVQKLTGAPAERQEVATVAHAPPAPPPRRPKLKERRRAAPARLELARPQSFYYYHHGLMHSPVSPMDAYVLASSSSSPSLSSSSSLSPSPHSSSSRGVVISKEEEEREEKAIACKRFYLHSSPRGGGDGDGERPKLLPLFPVHSPRSSFAS